jgi:hypothetical protein
VPIYPEKFSGVDSEPRSLTPLAEVFDPVGPVGPRWSTPLALVAGLQVIDPALPCLQPSALNCLNEGNWAPDTGYRIPNRPGVRATGPLVPIMKPGKAVEISDLADQIEIRQRSAAGH